MKLVAVDRKHHAAKVWRAPADFSFSAHTCMAPLVLAEVTRAASAMPIAFVRQRAGYELMGIMGLLPDENVFVDIEGQWLGTYVPAVLRVHPFRLARLGDERHDQVLCVDEDAGVAEDVRPGWQAFFDPQGRLSETVQKVLDHLAGLERDRPVTWAALRALDEAGLIKPWDIKVRQGGIDKRVEGLHRIDEAAVGRIDDQTFLALRYAGAVSVVYSQILSVNRLETLQKLASLRRGIARAGAAAQRFLPEQGPAGFQLDTDATLDFK